jgi:hypothetical protein
MIAINAGAVPLEVGRYVGRVEVDGEVKARGPFRVVNPPAMANPLGGSAGRRWIW